MMHASHAQEESGSLSSVYQLLFSGNLTHICKIVMYVFLSINSSRVVGVIVISCKGSIQLTISALSKHGHAAAEKYMLVLG